MHANKSATFVRNNTNIKSAFQKNREESVVVVVVVVERE